ncbi:hypothetical protein [Marinomonas sp. 2405UD68-3]|uniref:hypothetical protein n=1 Tax=Marinomonas sp. 2405UD68-3 TaxID=3391835 RepID=UPI0039C97CC7
MTSKKTIEEQDESLNIKPKKGVLKRFKTLFLIIALLLTFFSSIGGSVGLTLYLTQSDDVSDLQIEQMTELTKDITELQNRITQQDSTLIQIADNTEQLKTYLRHSSASSIKNIMLDQEKNIQSFLIVLKASMRDLSLIVGQSDDWQQDYDEQLNQAIQQSKRREKLLSILKTGEPVSQQ